MMHDEQIAVADRMTFASAATRERTVAAKEPID
jgi:hypothetical protein